MLGSVTTPDTASRTASHTVLLDVDGTLIDSFPGIRAGFVRALEAVGATLPSEEFIARIPGPPMPESMEAAGLNADEIARAMPVYMDYMERQGWREFTVFPGIAALIQRWKEAGLMVVTATSKSERFARLALDTAGILPSIDFLGAADHDRGRSTKVDVLRHVIASVHPQRPLMVGDRIHDYEGAAEFGIPSVAATWGYGDPAEWSKATYTARDTDELEVIVNNHVRT